MDSSPSQSSSAEEISIHTGIIDANGKRTSPWWWVPTTYICEGVPSAMAVTISTLIYKDLNVPNETIAFWTSWIAVPWAIKPLWSPVVDLYGTKRNWLRWTQVALGIAFAMLMLQITQTNFFYPSLLLWFGIVFISATHDIACDGTYLLGLNPSQQAWFSGIRSTFFRGGLLVGTAAMPYLVGKLQAAKYSNGESWSLAIASIACLFFFLSFWHSHVLPTPIGDRPSSPTKKESSTPFLEIFLSFFKQKKIVIILAFLLLYRLGESQLVKIAALFLKDPTTVGGIGLTNDQFGISYGTFGICGLLAGGLLSGILVSRDGFKKWILWMTIAINVPDLLYVYMAYYQPNDYFLITSFICIEQIGYGFGFTGYMIFMMSCAKGEYKAAHYAIATGFMTLGMLLPGMMSGYIQKFLGYPLFFVWVCIATIPGFLLIPFLPIDPEFGKRKKNNG